MFLTGADQYLAVFLSKWALCSECFVLLLSCRHSHSLRPPPPTHLQLNKTRWSGFNLSYTSSDAPRFSRIHSDNREPVLVALRLCLNASSLLQAGEENDNLRFWQLLINCLRPKQQEYFVSAWRALAGTIVSVRPHSQNSGTKVEWRRSLLC